MIRNLLQTLALLILPALSFAQSFSDGLYFGVNVNPGLMFNPQAYFPGAEFTTTAGFKAGYFTPQGIVGCFTGIQYTHYKYSAGHHGESGTQSLSFLEMPIGLKVLAGPSRGVKFYVEPSVSVCVLTAAHFDGYGRAYPTGNNKSDCTSVVAKPSLGWGFHINKDENFAVIIGWQLSTTTGNTYRNYEGTPPGNQHTTMAMQLGIEYHLSDLRNGREERHRPKPTHFRSFDE